MSQPQNQSFLKSLLAPLSKQLLAISQDEIHRLVDEQVAVELQKRATPEETYQFNVPPFFNLAAGAPIKPKPEGRINYSVLRNFSIHYPVARACIDYLKTKIIKLNYAIVPEDPEEQLNQDDERVTVIKQFLKAPLGKRSRYREMIEALIEDYMVVGAFALERMRTRGGQFLNELKLVDAATIQILIDTYGRLPEPPQPAFRQIINGAVVAELTRDEMIYIVRGTRTSSPYGISPIESIIIQAEAALQGARYSLAYFTDGNVPEGFGEMPEGWKTKEISEFQSYFDALMSGNASMQRKIKMVPKGFNYQAAKKPDALGYDRFELWLLQQTCSVFGVPPQDIGFTYQTNKSTGEVQQDLGQERGMRPLAQLFEQVFTDIITEDLRFEGLRFKFTDLDPVDAKMEAEVEAIRIKSGVISVDEARKANGLTPIGLGNYVEGNVTLAKDIINPPEVEQEKPQASPTQSSQPEANDTEVDDEQKVDLRTWMKQSKNALKQGKPFKRFVSSKLDDWMVEEVFKQLQQVQTKEGIEKVFSPYFSDQMQVSKTLEKLTNVLSTLSA